MVIMSGSGVSGPSLDDMFKSKAFLKVKPLAIPKELRVSKH